MDALDKADTAEQTAHGGRTEVGTPPWERRAARAKLIVSSMPRRIEVDRTVAESYQPHIYFAYSAGRIKIGASSNVADRAKKLNGDSALPVTIILTGRGSLADEAGLHEVFAEERLHNEWFAMSPRMRVFLDKVMCRKGRRKLQLAEAAFRKWLIEVTPPSRTPKAPCPPASA